MGRECDASVHAVQTVKGMNASSVLVGCEGLDSIDSSVARECEEVAVAAGAKPQWHAAATILVDSHVMNVTGVQWDASSVDGVINSSQTNTQDLLASTEDSVANSVPAEGHRVDVDSIGDTIVRDTPSDETLSSVLGSVPTTVEQDDHVNDEGSVG